VNLPLADSWAEARLGAKFRAVNANNAAYAKLRVEVMESPFLFSPHFCGERACLKSTLPAYGRAAWAQIFVEINGVRKICMPLQGCMQTSTSRDQLRS
jgi:hypothetical protein